MPDATSTRAEYTTAYSEELQRTLDLDRMLDRRSARG